MFNKVRSIVELNIRFIKLNIVNYCPHYYFLTSSYLRNDQQVKTLSNSFILFQGVQNSVTLSRIIVSYFNFSSCIAIFKLG